jgi:hypothetical protein
MLKLAARYKPESMYPITTLPKTAPPTLNVKKTKKTRKAKEMRDRRSLFRKAFDVGLVPERIDKRREGIMVKLRKA